VFTDFWFYTDVIAGKGSKGYFEQERKIRKAFDFYHDLRHDIFTHHYRRSALIITFSYAEKLVNELVSIVSNLQAIIINKSLSAHIFTLETFRADLVRINTQISNYGMDTATAIVPMRQNLQVLELFTKKQA
jgi:uncharacterized membrane protein